MPQGQKPSARIAKIYEQYTDEISSAPTLASMNRLEFMQVHKAIAELARIADELHEEKKEECQCGCHIMCECACVKCEKNYHYPHTRCEDKIAAEKKEDNFVHNIQKARETLTPCPDPNCLEKRTTSQCCGAPAYFEYKRQKGLLCSICREPFTPSPCKATEEKKALADIIEIVSKDPKTIYDAVDTKVDSWEEELADETFIDKLTTEEVLKLIKFFSRTRAEAISEHNEKVRKNIGLLRQWLNELPNCRYKFTNEQLETWLFNK